jgi:hypothetical protein
VSDDPLDQLNRFIISLVALVVVFAALVLVLLAWGATDATIGRVEDFAVYLRDHDGRNAKLVLTLSALVIALLMLTIMLVELTPSSTQRMRVRNVKSGEATLTTKQIAERIEEEVAGAAHIAGCRAIVAARGNRVEVVLDLHVDAGADLAQAADGACRIAHALVEERMGIALTQRPRARLHYRELRLKDGGPQLPATGWERPARDEGAQ